MRRRPWHLENYRPQLELLESRLAPGETMIGSLLGFPLLATPFAFADDSTGLAESAPASAAGQDQRLAYATILAGTETDTPAIVLTDARLVSAEQGSTQGDPSSTGALPNPASNDLVSSLEGNATLGQGLGAVNLHHSFNRHGAAAHAQGGGGGTNAAGSSGAPTFDLSGSAGRIIPPSHNPPLTRTPSLIVNVIPHDFSAETSYQNEPSIMANPLGPIQRARLVIGTFGPLPGHSGNPDFTSVNGGKTWDSYAFHSYSHGDTSMEWSTSGIAYQALLALGTTLAINPRSSPDPTTNDPTDQFTTIPGGNYSNGGNDQPWLRAAFVDGQDHIYIGFNQGRSQVRMSLDSGATWSNQALDRGTGGVGDAPPTRLAINGDTVYATFERRTASLSSGDYSGDVVVVRDDNGGRNGFQALGNLGTTVVQGVTLPGPNFGSKGTTLGHERIRSSTALTVDPNDPMTVYDAYTVVENSTAHVHLAMSTDGGVSWGEVLQIADVSALPSLAVTDSGVVGMLYTSLVDGNYQTHLIQSTDAFATTSDDFLFSFLDNDPKFLSDPYIGDYENIRTVGETFFGVFTASNNFNTAYSPYPVLMQRETFTDPVTGQFFLHNLAGGNVAFSLDPYFFAEPAIQAS